jgi:DNA-binding beta-propeller fold protein YncE
VDVSRILFLTLLAAMLSSGTAFAAPGDPYVVYTANSFASGAVVLRADPVSGSLVEVSRNGPQGTLFERPYDLAVEADGSLVVADLGQPNEKDGAVIRVDPLTGAQSLVSSGGEFFDPAGIAVGRDGQLWVVDNRAPDDDGAVIRVDPRSGAQTLVAEGGRLDLPFGIAVERDGGLLVSNRVSPAVRVPSACQGVGRVVRVDPVDGEQRLVSDGGSFALPLGLALAPDGTAVVANECAGDGGLIGVDPSNGRQRVITPNGANDVLETPERIAFDPAGAPLVSDFNLGPDDDGGIARVDPQTGDQTLVHAGELFNHPLGIAAVVDRPPSAALSVNPPAVAAGRPVQLDASGSSDPDGLPLVFEWDLDGDGGFEAGSGTTATAFRSFSRHGTATVLVRVNDRHGGRAVAEATVTIDGAVPAITRLRTGSRVLGVRRPVRRRGGRAGTAAAARRGRPPRATTVGFDLSEPAQVSLAVERARRGRRTAGGECRVRARRGPRCLRWAPVRALGHAGTTGANAIRLRARGLRPGRHRLVLVAVDAVGNRSAQRVLHLRVVRLRAPGRKHPARPGARGLPPEGIPPSGLMASAPSRRGN